jgi:hypothetical protein
LQGDIPVEGDFDGDAHADYVIFRPREQQWYIASQTNGAMTVVKFGSPADVPV